VTIKPAADLDVAIDHPRPQLVRARWQRLDGKWDFALDVEGHCHDPAEVRWDATIEVPFSPETLRSGINQPGFIRACWYRRTLTAPPLGPGDRLFLRFAAVDHHARVWLDGVLVGEHEGGYTPFSFDVTKLLSRRTAELVVQAEDDPADLAKPRGKQDWQAEPHSIWYARTTGIWQSVWLEVVPRVSIGSIRWTPNLQRWELSFEAVIDGDPGPGARLRVVLRTGQRVLTSDSYELMVNEVSRRIALSDPGIDDSRNELLWSPESPTLVHAGVILEDAQGSCLDTVSSYTALRTIEASGDRILLNGRPYPLRLVLDQGYWPESGLTAPDGDALRRDVELAKAMGFNGVRKHQKVEDPRYLHWADRLGLLVWEEMPSAYRFTTRSIQRVTREWMEVLARDYSHPCIIAWVPFNESWGVPNLPDSAEERHWVKALYHLTRTFDPGRLVIGNDGWESVATDVIGIHDYDDDPTQIALRYQSQENRPKLFRHARPGGRALVLQAEQQPDHPVVLSEFGGISCSTEPGTWGYTRCRDPHELALRYRELMTTLRSLDMLAGFCYTQFSDTYQEANGLLHADRTPKFPLAEIGAITRGGRRRAPEPG
jgi:beta-galactosidase/beta-glucuronidase